MLWLGGCLLALAGAEERNLTSDPPDGSPGALLRATSKVVFLGDSNTNAGTYISMLEAHFVQEHPELSGIEWINLGLSSETCTGLTEPPHPFPRPDVHERLDRALEKSAPDIIVACYGMNDGIYYPFGDQRFASFRAGMERLRGGAAS